MITRSSWYVAGLVFVLLASEPAFAQLVNRAIISRPSLFGPSTLTGRTGGNFTGRRDGRGLGVNTIGGQPSGGANLGFARPTSPGQFGFQRQNVSRGALPPIAALATTFNSLGYYSGVSSIRGLSTPANSFGDPLRSFSGATQRNQQLSGLAGAQSLLRDIATPLQPTVLPPAGPVVIPQTPQASYDQFFGLAPAEKEVPPGTSRYTISEDLPTIADEMSARLDDINAGLRRRALAAFKNVTKTENITDFRAIGVAESLLQSLKRTERDNPIPCILLAHLSFERDRRLYALANLSEASRRRPTIFAQDLDLTEYFGDADVLQRQIRKFIQAGTIASGDPEALVVEGYFAMLDNDQRRAREALQRAEEIAIDNSFKRSVRRSGINELLWSIRAAVQEQS